VNPVRKAISIGSLACIGLGCAASGDGSGFDNGSNPGGGGTILGAGGNGQIVAPGGTPLGSCDKCTDFPLDPIFDGVPATTQVSAGTAAGGPCIIEPEPNALFPRNWLRPRIRWLAQAGQNLFEIRVHAARENPDLVVVTSSTSFTMPDALWKALAAHVNEEDITVTVRAAGQQGSSVSFRVAPVDADGSMVYWATKSTSNQPTDSMLKGFSVGDEGSGDALTPLQVQKKVIANDITLPPAPGGAFSATPTQVTCIGCHTSTPDPAFVAFTAQWPWPNVFAGITKDAPGAAAPFAGPVAQKLLNPMQTWNDDPNATMLGIQTFNAKHWAQGDRIDITMRGSNTSATQLIWMNLDAASDAQGIGWGVIARTGDKNPSACAPAWNHAGDMIAYASAGSCGDGRMGSGPSDVALVPYGDKNGGQVVPLAYESGADEYYPSWSPDDALVAYNRAQGVPTLYNQPAAEVYVVPSAGGQPTRLAANDPPACTGRKSPGVQNSWPKWAPKAYDGGAGKLYYFLIFSSIRSAIDVSAAACPAGTGGASRIPNCRSELFVTGIAVNADKSVETHGAIYMWNQAQDTNNLTPVWDVIEIPDYIAK
jgi:hypothetical protein